MSDRDTAFQMAASNIRFGPGTTSEVGMDLADMSIEKAVVVIDPALVARTSLIHAASVAGLMLTTSVLVTELKEDKQPLEGAVA